jgi:hypothetical protein
MRESIDDLRASCTAGGNGDVGGEIVRAREARRFVRFFEAA